MSAAGPVMNRLAGGWQIAGSGSAASRWWNLPTGTWGTLGEVETYGTKYPVEDCRSGQCIPGYLYYNGYIPANRINSHDAQGRPNGVMGVPQNYRPSHQPVNPIPANGGSPSDPNYGNYETNNVYVTLKNGTRQLVAMDTGLHPWCNQAVLGPWLSDVSASLFKTVPITERISLRVNLDAFNVLNMPGLPMPDANSGILSLRTSARGARVLQWTARLSW